MNRVFPKYIREYHTQNNVAVVGLREGSWLQVNGESIVLKGPHSARIFEQGRKAYEVETASILDI